MATDMKGFKLLCPECGAIAIAHFNAGFIHEFGGDTGSLRLECLLCEIEVEIDSE